jgi:hypothetical protein
MTSELVAALASVHMLPHGNGKLIVVT